MQLILKAHYLIVSILEVRLNFSIVTTVVFLEVAINWNDQDLVLYLARNNSEIITAHVLTIH